jgi:hypothetical protein
MCHIVVSSPCILASISHLLSLFMLTQGLSLRGDTQVALVRYIPIGRVSFGLEKCIFVASWNGHHALAAHREFGVGLLCISVYHCFRRVCIAWVGFGMFRLSRVK